MIALNVIYTVRDGHMDQVLYFLDLMKTFVIENEPDCLTYQVSRSRDDANTLLLYEVYRSDDAVTAHGNTPHFDSIIKKEVIPRLENRVRSTFDVVIG
ncbi:putative quinol monooxygenase [Paradevosia shaoguanensis]|jgi:quinol monooxygenase YgiN|uniref:Antibiotic biosynthesis monooxygenase n=1 Tax=Paradevosia shaoguanensis TaxID=1335043 RepID=A0AA41UCW1_9HYPH|nr:putative quinol monooxygenase [Paradevosia shaoguanensis]KFL27932.1 hypothetical protein JP74_04835 [Devosia sp. 17-2-E-8]MBI4046429.1 antibiotic biosynthesis monooxygenase [Devosia nanyangense]QMV02441.1 antibiotic biosynthesis monooxygenase [Devosia sp. D6-9]CDP52071.1 hypothetical protein [Devosia sp. DBB001]MCF1742176.1 antibiotic biosynthesis monooxygenase [Paradevosia shaoguanensis]